MLAPLRLRFALALAAGLLGSLPPALADDDRAAERAAMVERALVAEGVTDERVLNALRTVPRHEFVRSVDHRRAYADAALPIGHGQTISPPFIVGYMTETLDVEPGMKVLEIGTGSGYQAAVLAAMGADVSSIEIVKPLGRDAGRRLKELGYENVRVKVGDGYLGWPEHAPFDRIIVTCSPESVPRPLVEQLAEGGKLLVPLGERFQQTFHLFTKRGGELANEQLVPTFFVPMTGESEERREVQPDGLRPRVANASFELDENGDGRADGWHYQRQTLLMPDARDGESGARVASDSELGGLKTDGGEAPDGQRYLRIAARDPDRLAQILQGLPVDGRRVGAVGLAMRVRGDALLPPAAGGPPAGAAIYFYDSVRRELPGGFIGPFAGTFDWDERGRRILVPPDAREMIVRVAVKGSGTLDVDALSLISYPRAVPVR
ncbi:protein-L-isoaspartate(D-aspartate) O-methyltransferase [Alienimonas californiensis]|uniref:Protein-L-isoaspartate O-methyltransferase n=1 Tax=Alienimonas californiensis TaxID=2527989 RepID=A0A517P4N9_9PLAN|nr:protein-L-isoaspartate(D-aspartate) O-methyltransferase [Alienimonas californiensis]QDT14334.1 Protein-L-isoaspartate O-methyltransferase [Alienimonas californiensis]